jgi:hypothetical protein
LFSVLVFKNDVLETDVKFRFLVDSLSASLAEHIRFVRHYPQYIQNALYSEVHCEINQVPNLVKNTNSTAVTAPNDQTVVADAAAATTDATTLMTAVKSQALEELISSSDENPADFFGVSSADRPATAAAAAASASAAENHMFEAVVDHTAAGAAGRTTSQATAVAVATTTTTTNHSAAADTGETPAPATKEPLHSRSPAPRRPACCPLPAAKPVPQTLPTFDIACRACAFAMAWFSL